MDLIWLLTISASPLTAGATLVLNWISLIPWRRNKEKHWSEQARLLAPALAAAHSNLWTIPAALTLIVALIWPNSSPRWLFTGIFSLLGVYAGTSFIYLEIFKRVSGHEFLRKIVIGFLVKVLKWLVFIGAAISMPDQFNLLTWSIGGVVILFWILWTRYGWLSVAKKLNIYLPAPERLNKIVANTSARMNIAYNEVLLIRSSFCQAYAVFNGRKLLFTERLLEVSSDEEIAAICAHELAHLTETKAVRFARYIQMLMYLPWLFFIPLLHTFGMIAFFGLFMIAVFVPRIYGDMSRKLESRADSIAKANEGGSGVYARALARIYEDNLTPAVLPKKNSTHPALYDRLLASGVTPDFSRPAMPGAMAWHGRMFSWLAWLLFFILAIRVAQSS